MRDDHVSYFTERLGVEPEVQVYETITYYVVRLKVATLEFRYRQEPMGWEWSIRAPYGGSFEDEAGDIEGLVYQSLAGCVDVAVKRARELLDDDLELLDRASGVGGP